MGTLLTHWAGGGPEEGGVMPPGQSILRQLKIDLLHEVMSEVMWLLNGCGSAGFKVNESKRRKWACFPVIVSNWCDTREGKDLLEVKHRGAVRAPCN